MRSAAARESSAAKSAEVGRAARSARSTSAAPAVSTSLRNPSTSVATTSAAAVPGGTWSGRDSSRTGLVVAPLDGIVRRGSR